MAETCRHRLTVTTPRQDPPLTAAVRTWKASMRRRKEGGGSRLGLLVDGPSGFRGATGRGQLSVARVIRSIPHTRLARTSCWVTAVGVRPQVRHESPPDYRPERSAPVCGYLRGRHPRQSGVRALGDRHPSHPPSPRASTPLTCRAPRRQGPGSWQHVPARQHRSAGGTECSTFTARTSKRWTQS